MILPLSHDSPEWLARMSLNLLPILPLLPPSIGLSACVHFCEVNVHMWYMWEWKLYVLRVCVCVCMCHQNEGLGLRCFSLQGEVFTPSHLHPTFPRIIVLVKASPDLTHLLPPLLQSMLAEETQTCEAEF